MVNLSKILYKCRSVCLILLKLWVCKSMCMHACLNVCNFQKMYVKNFSGLGLERVEGVWMSSKMSCDAVNNLTSKCQDPNAENNCHNSSIWQIVVAGICVDDRSPPVHCYHHNGERWHQNVGSCKRNGSIITQRVKRVGRYQI